MDETQIAPVTVKVVGDVDWEGLFDALVELGFGEDKQGFSITDVHKLSRSYAKVDFPKDGYPISRQRVYKWVMEKYQTLYAVRFNHSNAKDFRFAFQKEKLDSSDPRLEGYIYKGE